MKSKNLLKTYLMNVGKFFTIAAAFVFLTIAASQANAQNIDQCNPSTAGCSWQLGNLGKDLYKEGQAVPYRVYYDSLAPGNYSVLLTFGTTKNGAQAQDFLTTFDYTDPYSGRATNPNPCQPNADCNPNSATAPPRAPDSTWEIPNNPTLTALCASCQQTGALDTITNTVVSQHFSMWGGNITSTSGYTLSGSYATTGDTSITVNFTVTSTGPVVLSFGAHISSRAFWGFNTPVATDISGSPYHVDAGGHNCSMKASSVIFGAFLKVYKQVDGDFGTTFSTTDFGFTATGVALGDQTFNLSDRYVGDAPSVAGGSPEENDPSVLSNRDTKIIALFPSNSGLSGTVTEDTLDVNLGFQLATVNCTPTGNASFSTISSSASNEGGFNWTLKPLDTLTCTFNNTRFGTTAATAVVTGRVTTAAGKGIKGATVTASNFNGVQTVSVKTDAKGNYTFTKLETNDGYNFSASAKGYTLTASGQSTFFPLGDSQVVNFTGTAAAPTKGGKNQ